MLVIYHDNALCTNDLCEDVMNKLGNTCIDIKKIRVNNSKAGPDKYNLILVTSKTKPLEMKFNPFSANPTKWSNTLKQSEFECV